MINKYLQNFYGFAKRTTVPSLDYSQTIYEKFLTSEIPAGAKWLDIGCGHHLLPPWRFEQEKELFGKAKHIVGIDYDFPSLLKHRTISQRVHATADKIPFAENYFDVATANMVVEHLDNPQIQFAEICRVLKPNGIFIFHTVNENGCFARMRKVVPNALVKKLTRLLDGRTADDVFEVQYKANREETISPLAQKTNFTIEKIKLISSDAVFALVPPFAVAELFFIRLLMRHSLRRWRTNIIVILKKNI
ncbi:MAG: class I SAM-dependent methyltransferase [Pyrinomonadaceae bacterium]|nr:class I SAM-dependent methyltransferase [Pyrinomonadaceae bacterium]